MSPAAILTLGSLALIFVGQRLLSDTTGLVVSLLGAVGLIAALVMRVQARGKAAHPTTADAHKRALMLGVGVLASVGLYTLSTDWFVDLAGLGDEAASRWQVCFYALWPIVLLASGVPLLLVDRAIEDSPLAVQPLRVKHAVDNGLIAALGVSLLFPVNYLASEHNERFDLAYFKTTEVGGASAALVESLTEPVLVRIFLPNSSDVEPELLPYFEELAALNPDNFSVQVIDHAAEPVLAESLKVRDNGYVALTMNPGTESEVTKSWKIGTDLDKAERKLKKLDEEFNKRMLDLAKGERIAYFTVGHEELNWKGGELPEDKLTQLKTGLKNLNFKVKELGLTQGLGNAIPDDASVVVIMGPKTAFLPAELQAIQDYMARGGAVLIAVEPGSDEAVQDLLAPFGAQLGQGVLTSDKPASYLARNRSLSDRQNTVTNRYSSHESTTTLSKYSRQLQLITPRAGFLEQVDAGIPGTKTTVTVRSLQDNWADLDGDFELNPATEKREVRPIALVATGPATAASPESPDEPAEFRAVLVADATLFSNLALANQANSVFVGDALNWLLGDEELSGTTESEEDVKIEHTKDDEVLWFYGSSLGVPLILMLLGLLRVSRRRKSSTVLREEV